MDTQQLLAIALNLQQQINALVAQLSTGTAPSIPPATTTRPAREVPPCFDACKRMWDAAMNTPPVRTLFDVFAYVGGSNMTSDAVPRMTQDAQTRMEAAVLALGRSNWGQTWLSLDENAAMIDRRYCYYFVGYWIARKSNNPDDGFIRRTDHPGPIPT